MIDLWKMSVNSGDDVAGIVHLVGSNVLDFRPGDRVAGLHKPGTPNGSFGEYAVIEANTAWILGPQITFEQAATTPLNVCTAATGLYLGLGLLKPWLPAKKPIPLIVWGASSTVGVYVVQLARKSNVHPIICVAGDSKETVETVIDRTKGDTILDYRDSKDAIVRGIKNAATGQDILHAIECVSSDKSAHIMAEAMALGGSIALVLFEKEYSGIPSHVSHAKYNVMTLHETKRDFGFVLSRFVGRGLQQGWLRPQKHEVVPGGLDGVLTACRRLKEGRAHAVKYVVQP
ncbi:alcohol dehydrogenase-like protein [Xylariaceae sp. FL0662B]|nr:alcohol dehydrogenase-like protein [Xylariaceae sp. FL0662B]